MNNKLLIVFKLIQKGSSLLDQEKWKSRVIKGNLVVFISTLFLLINSFGFQFNLSTDDINLVASALIAIINAFFFIATSSEQGIPVKKQQQDKKEENESVFMTDD